MQLYEFQKKAVKALLDGKKLCIATMGAGKGSISLNWAHAQGKPNVLVITTASKRDVKTAEGLNDFENEADAWFPEWRKSLSSFQVVSWQGLAKWVNANFLHLKDYAIIADEIACMKAGVSSQRGKAFLKITNQTDCWTGYTGTPGDRWIDMHAYFVATHKVKNKTEFLKRFCQMQTFRGFPEIIGYNRTDILRGWWREIADTVDTSEMTRQLPAETHKVINFPAPTGYKKCVQTRIHPTTGDFMDTTGKVTATLRQMCSSGLKMRWVSDFVENLGERAVIFYNFIEEGNLLEETIKKALPEGAKVWRVDGSHHDVPTAETCGEHDIVITQWAAGAMGLNLQFMNHWISLSPNYSYSISTQARGRIKRIGQEKHMNFWYLMCEDTIEEDVYKCLRNKSDFAEDTWLLQKPLTQK